MFPQLKQKIEDAKAKLEGHLVSNGFTSLLVQAILCSTDLLGTGARECWYA